MGEKRYQNLLLKHDIKVPAARFIHIFEAQHSVQDVVGSHAATAVRPLPKLPIIVYMPDPVYHHSGIKNVSFGENVTIVQPVNLYGCTIGDQTFIGPFTEIQKDVTIGSHCKIQSHSFICELVTIGNHCFIGHGVMFINDVFAEGIPAQGNKNLWKKTFIGNNVSIGSNATILPVTICDSTVIGAGAVVTKNITVPGVYAGNPARKLRDL